VDGAGVAFAVFLLPLFDLVDAAGGRDARLEELLAGTALLLWKLATEEGVDSALALEKALDEILLPEMLEAGG
jgi:hypothetical protein